VETVLFFAVVIGLTAVFVWLRRSVGDDWPPPEPGEAVPQTTIRSESGDPSPPIAAAPPAPRLVEVTLPPASSVPEPVMAAPELPAAPKPEPIISDTAVAEATIAAPSTALPAPVARPAEPAGRTAVALMAGGGVLLLLTLLTSPAIPPGERGGIFLLTLLGGLALLLGVQTARLGRRPGWLDSLLGRLARFLRVDQGQVVFLLLALPFAGLARLAAGNDLLARQPVLAILAWLAAIGLAVAGSVSRETSGPSLLRRLDRWDWLAMGVLFVVALLLRGVATAQFPNTFSGDEGSAGLFGRLILDGGANNPFIAGWFSFPSLYFAIQSVAIALGGQTVEAVRLTSAVAGALSVVALYALGRAMFDRTTALLAAAYLAASHYHIHMSRIALNNVWDGLFGTLAIAGLWAGWKTGRRGAFILCGLALGLGQYFYVAIRVLPVVFLIWSGFAWWRQRTQFRDRLPGLVVAALIALVVYLPLGLYFIEKPDEFQAPLNRVTIFGDWLEGELARGERTTPEIIADQALAGVLGFTHEPLRLLYNPGSPLLLGLAATLFMLGILWALINMDLRYLLLLLPLGAAVAANAVSQDSPASQRYILVMPLVALFVALPLGQAAAWVREARPRFARLAGVGVAAVLLVVALIDLNYYFNEVYDTYVLGGGNTEAATAIAYTLRDTEPAAQDVYFFGFPRMGYFSLSTIPFLAPEMRGQDVAEPLTAPPEWALAGPTLFVFLPERLNELPLVEAAYPGGDYEEVRSADGELLFAVYRLS
jgi:hypothetical protein